MFFVEITSISSLNTKASNIAVVASKIEKIVVNINLNLNLNRYLLILTPSLIYLNF